MNKLNEEHKMIHDIQFGPQTPEKGAHPVDIPFRRLSRRFSGPHNLVAVLVRACEKIGLLSFQDMEPSQDVRHDRGVGMPQMRLRVHVVDGGRDIEWCFQ